jgi:hypothetical protein
MAEVAGLPVCHRCGAALAEGTFAYCSEQCRAEARALALAGEKWTPPDAFAEAVRATAGRGRP